MNHTCQLPLLAISADQLAVAAGVFANPDRTDGLSSSPAYLSVFPVPCFPSRPLLLYMRFQGYPVTSDRPRGRLRSRPVKDPSI
jgi:hypothetical protein